MHALRSLEKPMFRALALALPLLLASPAFAVTDRRAHLRAAAEAGPSGPSSAEVGPSIPEPSSIFLFALGVGVVGYGVHRRLRAR